jgi:hypothetical protein
MQSETQGLSGGQDICTVLVGLCHSTGERGTSIHTTNKINMHQCMQCWWGKFLLTINSSPWTSDYEKNWVKDGKTKSSPYWYRYTQEQKLPLHKKQKIQTSSSKSSLTWSKKLKPVGKENINYVIHREDLKTSYWMRMAESICAPPQKASHKMMARTVVRWSTHNN